MVELFKPVRQALVQLAVRRANKHDQITAIVELDDYDGRTVCVFPYRWTNTDEFDAFAGEILGLVHPNQDKE